MTSEELIDNCLTSIADRGHIVLSADVLRDLSPENVEAIQQALGTRELMMLPEHEIRFYEWLREADAEVWNDLWAGDTRAPYLVSLAYLSLFTGERPGVFHIRDLRSVDNYFFAPEMILEKESVAFLEASRNLLAGRQPMSPAQLLALEASMGPTDVWHFAYRHNLPVLTVKLAVRQLVDDRILLHVPDADHLTAIFDVR
jgi:hypothetical protein